MKTIYDQLEDDLKAIETPEEVVEEVIADEPVETPEEPTETPEPVEVEAPKEEPKPDHSEVARLNWENRELKRREREATEAAQRAIEIQKANEAAGLDPEPNEQEDTEAWLKWKVRQSDKVIERANTFIKQEMEERQKRELISGAIEEFTEYENRFVLKAPDYNEAAAFFQNKVKESIATLNPQLSEKQVQQMLTNQLLTMGSQFVNQGLDPAEAIYNIAKRQGFTKSEVKQDNKPQKASLETVEKNKQKSANGLGAGAGKSPVTIASLEKASVQDMYSMTDEEIYNAMYK